MKKLWLWIKTKWAAIFPSGAEVPVVPQVPPRRKRQPNKTRPLWPVIEEKVGIWEEMARDSRVHWSMTARRNALPASHYLKAIYDQIPAWGVYCCSGMAEVRQSDYEQNRINLPAFRPNNLSWALFGSEGPERLPHHDDNILTCGVSMFHAVKSTRLEPGTYPMNEGVLYDVQCSHWERNEGHDAFWWQVIIDSDGVIHPTWHWRTEGGNIRHKRPGARHVAQPVNRYWEPVGGRGEVAQWVPRIIASAFNLSAEREFHWNCTVKSEGVAPICFPVRDHDIARVFPRKQRDGEGKIVHWTKAHLRRTKNGETAVRTHIRGNTSWEIEGRHVSITMPGKHHGMVTQYEAVAVDGELGQFRMDPVTGLVYSVVGDSLMRKLLSRAHIKIEKIEVAA